MIDLWGAKNRKFQVIDFITYTLSFFGFFFIFPLYGLLYPPFLCFLLL